MTTFADLVTRVSQLTGRPELTTITNIAIRTAVIRAHCTSFFFRDKFASAPQAYMIDSSKAWIDLGDVYSIIPTLRSLKFVQCVDSSGTVSENLTMMEVDDTYGTDGWLKDSIYKLDGTSLKIHPIVQTGFVVIHGYQMPVIADVGFSSWIADMFPDEIAHWAAAIVLFRTGADEIAKASLQTNVQPFKELLIESFELAQVN